MKHLSRTLSLLLVVVAAITASAANVNDIMSRTASALTGKGSLTADFAISAGSGNKTQGQIKVNKSKYLFTSAVNAVIFDGKTQWSIDKQTREVNIYEPDKEEIAQSNPLSIISSYKSAYKSKLLSSAGGVYKVELTPTASAQSLKKIVLSINSSTMLPTKMVITATDGTNVTIDISNIKTGVNIPASTFVFKQSAYTSYEIVDLR